ncbi:MAG: zinc ribbon domain-containing protein [Kofleriaceae bacterium]|nr:zinc ribbon domain-containing protein [Kofleriaceae bacterium]
MPVYEYGCTACGKEFEYQQRMADPPKTVCEACGGALERLISRSAFQFKGGGWYKDLYSSSKPDAGGGSSAGATSTGTGTSGTGTGTGTGTGGSGGGDGGGAAPAGGGGGGGSTPSGGSSGGGGGSAASTS